MRVPAARTESLGHKGALTSVKLVSKLIFDASTMLTLVTLGKDHARETKCWGEKSQGNERICRVETDEETTRRSPEKAERGGYDQMRVDRLRIAERKILTSRGRES